MSSEARIFVVHALQASLAPVAEAFAAGWKEAQVCNLMDDALSRDRRDNCYPEEAFARRFGRIVDYCANNDADGILFACSAFNEAIESARRGARVPVLKPEEAMIADALELGERFAVVATFEPSIGSLRNQFDREASARGKSVSVEGVFVRGAMAAFDDGDAARHDALIADAVAGLADVQGILLAQFSMARAAPAAAPRAPAPLLTSPVAAVARLRALVTGAPARDRAGPAPS